MASVEIRSGRRSDCAEIARLFLISSDGLAEYIWRRMAEGTETVVQAGARRYTREGVAFSYQNCLMAEASGRVVGMAHSFGMDRNPDAVLEVDPVLRPYSELEDYGSLYLSGLAIHEDWRGRGVGGQLMAAVNARAKNLGRPRHSLICFERNEPALRFYRRLGFSEIDRREIVPHPTLHYTEGDALLMARPIW